MDARGVKTAAQVQGRNGEDIACSFLRQKGYEIVERNYRIPGGEIDVIAKRNNELVFVEVKTRSSVQYGYPEEAVTHSKKIRLARAARSYIGRYAVPPSYRFDIIAIHMASVYAPPSISHFENILDDILL
jgi:putative endonuclease